MKIQTIHHEKETFETPVILIAGGAGLIGSFLTELLLSRGCRVVVIDNLISGRRENLANCFGNPLFSFFQQDLTVPIIISGPINYVFHLAGLEKLPESSQGSIKVLKTNVQGTINLLNLAKKKKAKFLLASGFKMSDSETEAKDLMNLFEKKDYFSDRTSNKATVLKTTDLEKPRGLAEKLTFQFHQKEGLDVRVVRVGFFYGPRMNLEANDWVTFLIKDALKGGPLRVMEEGSLVVYPTFISDIIYGLSKAMFSLDTNGKSYFLVNPEPVTLHKLAQEIKKLVQTDLKIEFVSQSSLVEQNPFSQEMVSFESPFSPDELKKSQTELGWKPKVETKQGIKQTLAYFKKRKNFKKRKKLFQNQPMVSLSGLKGAVKIRTKTVKVRKNAENRETKRHRPDLGKKPVKKAHFLNIWPVLMALLILLVYPFASLAISSLWGLKNLQAIQRDLKEADLSSVHQKAQSAFQAFSRADKKFQTLNFLLVGQDELSIRWGKIFRVGRNLSQGVVHLSLAAQESSTLGKIIFQNQPGEVNEKVESIQKEIDFAYDRLSLTEAELSSDPNLLPSFVHLKAPLSELRSLLLEAKKGLTVLPSIIGLEGRKVFLVLLQNNMELRPTGGFIGSFGLVTFNQGRLIDFEVFDVYQADGQLKGHVEPPEEIKKHLGEASWYLRDANWHPDFPVSAQRAAWFLEKEMGRSVDGVIGVDLTVAENILARVGEIELSDFQEKINHQNLFERAEYHSEVNFFPGSTAKKDFLGSLAGALFEKVKNGDEKTWLALIQAIDQSLREKDLLIYLDDQAAMAVLTDLEWDGRVKGITCQDKRKNCLVDYLMIVEANLGVNKANFFVKRKISHQVIITPAGGVKEKLSLEYDNQSLSDNFPAGRYKNYLRILIPKETKLEQVFIGGKKLEEKEIDQKEISGKKSFGFLVEVPIKSQVTVRVEYELEKKIDLSSPAQYLHLLQKQPGIKSEDFVYQLTGPPGFSLIEPRPAAKTSRRFDQETGLTTDWLLFNPQLNQDIVIEAALVQ